MEVEPKLYRAIMVSSTFTDLEAHRREVIDSILRFGFQPNVMEYSGARSDADVIDTSLRMVRDSVAYLCVIGHKYGQTPLDADRNPKGLSITELEFNEARRLDRPILLFLMADDHPVTKEDVEPEARKRKKLKAFCKQAKRVDPDAPAERVYETFASKEEFAKKAIVAIGLQAMQMAGGSDIPDRAIRDAIARFIDVKPEANQAELTGAIERFEADYRALKQQLAVIPVSDNRVTASKADAEAALAEGDLDKARAAYREAAEAARDKAAEPVRTAAELKSAEAGAHLLALDWQAADAAWTEATAMLAPFDSDAADEFAEDAAGRLSMHGELYARAGALRAAINRWHALTASAETRGDEREAARLRNNLGNALATQGERTGGPEGLRLLDEAVTAYRDGLTVHTRADMPARWARTQNNLGTALQAQGERTGGPDGLRLLNEAVTAYRDALTVRTRTDMPAEWASTQNNLGTALKIQGERTGGPEGLRLLDEAVTAYRHALTVRTRADMPVQWAATQNNLGIALQTQGRGTGGPEGLRLLDEAVTAYRDALTVRIRADMPADWAMTQNNLGNALQTQGHRTGGPEGLRLLDEAVTAYREALTVRTRADMPVDWAMTQNNLGSALQTQGEHTGGPEGLRLLNEAITAYREALTVYTRADMPAQWAMTQENVGLAFESIAELDPDRARAHLLDAEAALVAALGIYTPEHMAFYHDKATGALARIRAKLAALDT
jgi:tetratricopeptide (TPR) repeat protein